MPVPIRGLIEGFYGTPWTWDERIEVMQHCAALGMTHYVYAPKDDPKHRERWRELYAAPKLAGFSRLISEGGLTVGFGISPGLDIGFDSAEDRAALFAKVDQVVDLGAPLVVLALDDIPFDPTAGADHARLTADLVDHLAGRAAVALVPTEYVGTNSTPYLQALAEGVPADVPIAWTGPAVVNDAITAHDARARAQALGGRAPLLWDNYPVNDGTMSDRLFMGPLWGREPELLGECSGYLANPMVQARASKLPLASIAGWLRGEDPLDAWVQDAGDLRVFAEACDGAVPQALAQLFADEADGPQWAAAAEAVAAWFASARTCLAPGLVPAADPWLRQVHREARLALSALRLFQAAMPSVLVDEHGHGTALPPQPDVALIEAMGVAAAWPRVRRGEATVMGVRCGFRPLLTQRADGAWRLSRASVEEGGNAVDTLVRLALDVLDELPDGPEPVEVLVDGEPVPVGDDGSFAVPPGTEIVVVSAGRRTTRVTPCGPPVPPPA